MKVRVCILTGFGINCEHETALAFERAGAEARLIHLNDLSAAPDTLTKSHIFAIPGGFSFGDDIASGKVLANRLKHRLGAELQEFVDAGKPVIGICNGFQVLVKMGLLPYFDGEFTQESTLTHNDSARFDDRWVNLAVDPNTRCIWLSGIERIELPIRHGEGKFAARDDGVLARLSENGQIALRYACADGSPADGVYPFNPNGSQDDIAGICDPSGRIFGLMPHPEAHIFGTQHPRWTRETLREEGAGLAMFRNAVRFAEERLLHAAV